MYIVFIDNAFWEYINVGFSIPVKKIDV